MLDARRAPPPPSNGWRDPTDDPAIEQRIRQLALPLALGLAFLVMHSGLRGMARAFLTMWVHESGHAVTAWLCGFGAFPGPWRTPVSESRLAVVTVLVVGAIGYGGLRAWQARARGVLVGLGALLLLQLVLTFGLRARDARALITFMGDGGCLLLGAGLMATIYVAPGSALHRGWLRWGFLVIGAFAFMDAFATWWEAKHSLEGVAFGHIEGVGDSDPTRLVFDYGWREARLPSRYLALGWAGLVFLAGLYLVHLRRPSAE